MQRGNKLLENDFYKLNESRNYKNEYDGLKIGEIGSENVVVNGPCNCCCAKHNKDYCNARAGAYAVMAMLRFAGEKVVTFIPEI